ncbi:putative adomet-dependent trna methyltransferase complex subunit trm112 [Phaeomoniella chlamydospora]|uniref:Putative adomet-dependent trna methyltransferase complex subunit trm112 n=1 Tax=Phaeomoniella chlamydospora TaxID=158046 RepID=A0A0G2H0Z4_PHACM|nr:putative adomet-dependent trna methyltransferase complex subunit trm112 [Phaeomoniella chlamydospora]
MKLLTLQFLTCAIKTCKSKTLIAQPLPPSTTTTTSDDDDEDSNATTSSPFPLHPISATLERTPIPYNPLFLLNILPRLDWTALKITATEFGLVGLLPGKGEGAEWEKIQDEEWREGLLGRVEELGGGGGTGDREEDVEMDGEEGEGSKGEGDGDDAEQKILNHLHLLLLETEMMDGALKCGSCGHEYGVKEGVGNFLLPAHLV